MSGRTLLGLALLLAGVLALTYGGFTYTKETHDAKIGPIEFSVKDKERVNIPMWAGGALAVAGAVILITKKKK